MRPYLKTLFVAVVGLAFVLNACSDDPTAPPGREYSILASQDFLSADLELSRFPAGSSIELRTGYWSTSELTADPGARISTLSDNVYRLSFANLSSGIFATEQARILLRVVDSAVDELTGIVVLCDSTGPIILDPQCQGDCAPLCGLDGHGCAGEGPRDPN